MGDTIRKKLALLVGIKPEAAMKGVDLLKSKIKGLSQFTMRWAKRAALGIIGIGVAIIKVGMDFDTAMRDIWTLLPNVSRQALDKMADQVLGLAVKYGKSSRDLAKAMYDVVSAQVAASEQMDVLEAGAMGAVAGLTSTKVATSALISVMKTFGEEAGSANLIMDKLFKVVEYGRLTFEELAANIGPMLPIMKAAGVKFEEGAAGLAVLTGAGIATAEATTALTRLFESMAAPQEHAAKEMKKLGISFKDTQGKMLPLRQILQQFVNLDLAAIREVIPRITGATGMIALSGSFEQYGITLQGIREALGATDIAFEKQAAGLRVQLGIVREIFRRTGIEVYAIFAEDIVASVMLFREKARDLLTWVRENKGVIIGWGVSFKVALQKVWDVANPLFEFLWKQRKTIGITFAVVIAGTLAVKVYGLVTALWAMSAALVSLFLAMGPAGWIVLGLGAIGGGLFLVNRKLAENERKWKDWSVEVDKAIEKREKIDKLRTDVERLGGEMTEVWVKTEEGKEKLELVAAAGGKLEDIDLTKLGQGVAKVDINAENATSAMEKLRKKVEETTNETRKLAKEVEKISEGVLFPLGVPRRIPIPPERVRYAPRAPMREMEIPYIAPPRPIPAGPGLPETLQAAIDSLLMAPEELEERYTRWEEVREEWLGREEHTSTEALRRRQELYEEHSVLMEKIQEFSGKRSYKIGSAMYKLEEQRLFEFGERTVTAFGVIFDESENRILGFAQVIISSMGQIARSGLLIRMAAGDWTAYIELAVIAAETAAALAEVERIASEAERRRSESLQESARAYGEIEEGERRIYGRTIAREPQQVTIAPVLNVEAAGDIYFGVDGLEAAGEVLIEKVKQAVEDGEISV